MGWFRRKKKTVVQEPVEKEIIVNVNPPKKTPRNIARAESRIKVIEAQLTRSDLTEESRLSFRKELARWKALIDFWGGTN